jgi:ubiquinone/menaquinone biosynthesis C-methylase UbiE
MTSSKPNATQQPDPGVIFDTILSYQRSAALKTAVELDLFTHVARGHSNVESLARATGASQRGVRILCDYLVITGLLEKNGASYSLPLNSAVFLNKESPAYIGGITTFMLDPAVAGSFSDLTRIVREGTTTLPDQGTVTPDNPVWVEFAKSMAALMRPAALQIAERFAGDAECSVLDIAAGHGLFGISIAQRNPKARITALDWAGVLDVAKANAQREGVADRYTTRPGDAFTVDYGGPYDTILLTNFLHHFDIPTCETLARKVLAALKPGGRSITLEFVPNADRVSPPIPASFSMMMLGSTPSGDAYTFDELDSMFRNAGFERSEAVPLVNMPQTVIVSTKKR